MFQVDNGLRNRLHGSLCVYCGEEANSEEHFPPRSLCRVGWILPACKECNSFASTVWSFDFQARCRHVKDKLRARYRRELGIDWSDDEITVLGRNLQTSVKNWQSRQQTVKKRVAWNVMAYLACIDPNNDFAAWLAEIASTTSNEKLTWRNLEKSVETQTDNRGQLRWKF